MSDLLGNPKDRFSHDAAHFSSKEVALLWFSVVCFWSHSFGDVSPYVFSYHF